MPLINRVTCVERASAPGSNLIAGHVQINLEARLAAMPERA